VITSSKLCPECKNIVVNEWKQFFGELGKGMGSGLPLKDVSLLTQIIDFRWEAYTEWRNRRESRGDGRRRRGLCCSLDNLLDFLDERLRELYEEVASRYWKLAEYVNVDMEVSK
jgi:hypothetical protein